MQIEAVDLFCGVGGLTAGLIQAGIKVKAGYDIAEDCRFAYEYNNQAVFVKKDVAEVSAEDVLSWYSEGSIKLLAGCAPCQPFSTYNQGRDTTKDVTSLDEVTISDALGNPYNDFTNHIDHQNFNALIKGYIEKHRLVEAG